MQHKFVTQYTSLILTTDQVDPGLNQSGSLTAPTVDSNEDSSESMEYGPYLSGTNNLENRPEKLILMQSISPSELSPLLTSPQTLVAIEETKPAAALLLPSTPLSSIIVTEQLPKPSLLRAPANETTQSYISHVNHNATLSTTNRTTTTNSTNNEQLKSFLDRFQDFSKRFAKLVFKPSKIGNKNNWKWNIKVKLIISFLYLLKIKCCKIR